MNGTVILYASLALVGGLVVGVALRGVTDVRGWTSVK